MLGSMICTLIDATSFARNKSYQQVICTLIDATSFARNKSYQQMMVLVLILSRSVGDCMCVSVLHVHPLLSCVYKMGACKHACVRMLYVRVRCSNAFLYVIFVHVSLSAISLPTYRNQDHLCIRRLSVLAKRFSSPRPCTRASQHA